MKVFTLLLIFICLLTSVQLYGQKPPAITLSVKNVSLETVLAQIKKQTGITFVYNKEVLKIAGKLSIQVEKADLKTVLKMCFRNTSVNFSVYGNTVALSTKNDEDGNMVTDSSFFSQGVVHGSVYDIHQKSLSGASVIIKRSQQGVNTDAKGEFVLENVRTNDTLRVSFMGYTQQEQPVAKQTQFQIYLKEAENDLDVVMIQAYGSTTKRLSVGEITQVTAAQIEKQPVTNVLLALQGLVPGMTVSPTSGFTGGPVKVEIRGRNTLADVPSDPLYVIDGVPLIIPNLGMAFAGNYNQGSPGLIQSGLSASGGQSLLFNLNPNDIESISVLKDASATTLYGSRAGNGVILITTKKGRSGKTQFDINVNQVINKSIGYWDMLNTSQYLQMRREAFRNDGLIPGLRDAPDLTLWDTTRYVNWQKELWKTGKTTEVTSALSGGNQFLTFRLGSNYSAIQDISTLNNRNANQRAGVNLSLNFTSLNQKLNISFGAGYAYTKTDQVPSAGSATLAPNVPAIFDNSGNFNLDPWNETGLGNSFPFYSLRQSSIAKTLSLTSNLSIKYEIIKGLTISTDLGYQDSRAENKTFLPIASQNPLSSPLGSAYFGENDAIVLNINPNIRYSRYIGKGNLEVLTGATLGTSTGQGNTITGSGYTGDELLKSINNAPNKTITEGYAQNKTMELLASLKYTWENKYIVEFSGNRSGSSSFGPGRQFGNFGVAGAAWIASEEKWLAKTLPSWISLIKFTGNYGTSGISGGDYQYLSQWRGNIGSGPLFKYNGSLPLVPLHAVNQDYRWQTNKKLNGALDLGFLNDRFRLRLALYQNRIVDQLTSLPTPIFTGFLTVQGNSKAKLQNAGKEISIYGTFVNTKNVSWSADFNISTNANKLLDFPGIEYTPYYRQYKIGEPINTLYLLHYLGIDPQTGEWAFEDYNRDGKLTSAANLAPGRGLDDRYITLNPDPKFFGGAGTNLRYRQLSFSLRISFEKRTVKKAYSGTPGSMGNVPASALINHWQKPGDIALNPRLLTMAGVGGSSFNMSDGAYTDGSYIRLQNVNVNYHLPESWAKSIGTKSIGLTMSIQNVFTLTKYDGVDPQTQFGGTPQPKMFSGSIRFSF